MKLRDVSDTSDVHTLIFSVIDDDDNDDVWCKKKKESRFRNQRIFLWTLFKQFLAIILELWNFSKCPL